MLRYLASFAAGVLLTSLVFWTAGSRYRLHKSELGTIRMDTWTGRSSKLVYNVPTDEWIPLKDHLR